MPVRGKGDDIGKIFVGGLATSTLKEGLQSYFEKFGEVTDCVLMTDPVSKRSRGFGFVTFREPSTVDKILKSKPHVLDNKTIDPKPAVPRGPGQAQKAAGGPPGAGGPQRGGGNDSKVFVGGLAYGTTEDDLREYFGTYGPVKHVQLMYDKETQKMRGFGFLTFDSKESVDKTTQIQFHQINGKMVEVKKAEYREKGQGPQGQKEHHMGGNPLATPVHGMGGGMGAAGAQYGGQFMPQGGYGQQGAMPAMGRGYGAAAAAGAQSYGYGAGPGAAGAYGGYAPPGPSAYGAGAMAMGGAPPAGAGPAAYQGGPGYGAQPGPAAMGGYGAPAREVAAAAAYGAAPGYGAAYGASPGAIPGGAGEFGQAGIPPTSSTIPGAGGAPGGAPRGEVPGAADFPNSYSAYGMGSYQQTESQYGPTRGSFPADPGYGGYPGAEAYGAGAGGAAAFAGESFGRGGGAANRGFHPYGR